ncbi:MAG: GNAT family N-acetyltransferase [Cyclobacteriaceae bacterium]
MERANSNQKQRVIEILSRSFDKNPSVNYVVKPGPGREHRIRKLMEYSYDMCNAFGQVWISEDGHGCTLILMSDRKRTSIRTLLWDLKLAVSAIGLRRVGKVMNRESRIKAFHPTLPYSHLWFIGVDPDHQGKGSGSSLLKEVIEECERRQSPIYLETSVDRNLSWYKKFGFEIFHTLDLGYTLYFLKREQR